MFLSLDLMAQNLCKRTCILANPQKSDNQPGRLDARIMCRVGAVTMPDRQYPNNRADNAHGLQSWDAFQIDSWTGWLLEASL